LWAITSVGSKNSRNSLQSCAARVLLCAITRLGRCTCSMVNAIVAVLPEPVTPSMVWKRSPSAIPWASPSRAFGWSATAV